MSKIFVPYQIDKRSLKYKQTLLKFLQQQIIYGDLDINDDYDFPEDLVQVTMIKGNVSLETNSKKIPEWLKNVVIVGNLDLDFTYINSLRNCPKLISGEFSVMDTRLKTLHSIKNNLIVCNTLFIGLKNKDKNNEQYIKQFINSETIIIV